MRRRHISPAIGLVVALLMVAESCGCESDDDIVITTAPHTAGPTRNTGVTPGGGEPAFQILEIEEQLLGGDFTVGQELADFFLSQPDISNDDRFLVENYEALAEAGMNGDEAQVQSSLDVIREVNPDFYSVFVDTNFSGILITEFNDEILVAFPGSGESEFQILDIEGQLLGGEFVLGQELADRILSQSDISDDDRFLVENYQALADAGMNGDEEEVQFSLDVVREVNPDFYSVFVDTEFSDLRITEFNDDILVEFPASP